MSSELEKTTDTVLGSVMVVGGGIAGIQASLDLAESGYYVYLVDQSPAIGGVMPQLDKTFPTNDCSMCILSPKLVECGRHLNIEVLTYSELQDLQGKPGSFKALVKKKARFVDPTKCTGCGECATACPVELSSEFDQGLVKRKAIYRPYAQAFPNVFTIDKHDRPPCVNACPAGVNPQGYTALIAKGKYREALSLIRETLPLPRTLGRICPHPCEQSCNRASLEAPVAVCALKRFVADMFPDEPLLPLTSETKPERVAIVGSGPAGLTAAYHLARAGYKSTIFEALPVAGGMLAVGIPSYRLPKDVIQSEIKAIEQLGVEIRVNSPIGEDLTVDDLLRQGYSSVFLAVGAHGSRSLDIPGESARGVLHGVDFLRDLNLGNAPQIGRRVIVIGGGDVAIDAARCAVRVGGEQVSIYYRRSEVEMPARKEEVHAAREEGVDIEYLVAPVQVIENDGVVVGLRCVRMELTEPDARGRRQPVPISGSEFDVEADTIIVAVGQVPKTSCLPNDVVPSGQGTVAVDSITFATRRPGVFAGGDCTSGPALAIDAVAAGKEAAESIIRYLSGQQLDLGRERRQAKAPSSTPDVAGLAPEPRAVMPELAPEIRVDGFEEIETGLSEVAALREANRCLQCGVCSECMQCVSVCKANCIDHTMKDEVAEVEVGAVILTPGFEPYDPKLSPAYGYGKNPDVVTSLEFERILSASGPFQGHLTRPSDGATPKKVAWIQCVGSRDFAHGAEYCSAVCCMYALKEAVIAKEHASQPLDTAIFYMDMRTHGKDFEQYLTLAKDVHGVRLVRSRIHSVERGQDGGAVLRYVLEDGTIQDEHFDLVVLSVGLRPPKDAADLALRAGVEIDRCGFCQTDHSCQVASSRPGVFVAGAFSGPKDIPETVAQASAAAGEAAKLLTEVRGTLVSAKKYPPERDVMFEKPRIGVFVCHCGINIGGIVNVPAVRDYAATLPNVVLAEDNLYTCSQDTQERIKRLIEEHGLNRVVVASCSPRTHEPIFQDTIREAGLNRHLFEMANIRDQCSWVHMHEPELATEKAKDLVRMTIARVRMARPLDRMSVSIEPAALVVGGGVAGMTASLSLAEQGFRVDLVERTSQLGGMARRIHFGPAGTTVQPWIQDLREKVLSHPSVRTHLNTEIEETSGFVGNFETQLRGPNGALEVRHGVAILATGSEELSPTQYLYGDHQGVRTMLELEEAIANRDSGVLQADNVVLIQCVGSRDSEHPYCSRVCCAQSVRIALALKALKPDMGVYVLYRDLRTYGMAEAEYRDARKAGVLFLRYEPEDAPVVSPNGPSLQVEILDRVLGERLLINADLVGLAAAALPAEGAVARQFKTPLNQDGFLLEAHAKLRPVDSNTEGVFLCGAGLGPKSLSETVIQAEAAAARAVSLLSKGTLEVPGTIAVVNSKLCAGCGVCELVCPYGAISLKQYDTQMIATVNEALCKGCGACAASCRSGAVDVNGASDRQILSAVAVL